MLCGVLKDRYDLILDLFKLLDGISEGSTDDIIGLGHTNLLEDDTSLVFNNLNKHFLFERVECDALSGSTSTSSTTRSVNIGFCVFRRLNLDDQVDTRDVKTTGCDISSNKHTESLLLEALECHFTLHLRDVTVHDFDVFFYFF